MITVTFKVENEVCWCPCHLYPGAYDAEPCHVCSHFNSNGTLINGFQGPWVKSKEKESVDEDNSTLL